MKLQLQKWSATMEEGAIESWRKQEGDFVREGEILYEAQTDKKTMEVESSVAGTLEKILIAAGETVAVGTDICVMRAEGEAGRAAPDAAAPEADTAVGDGIASATAAAATQGGVPQPGAQETAVAAAAHASGSQGGFTGGYSNSAVYNMTKGAILTLTKSFARTYGPDGIRVNAIAPGMVDTDMLKLPPAQLQEIIDLIPLKRLAAPAEMVGGVLFLASPLSAYVNGATLDVNGGQLMR